MPEIKAAPCVLLLHGGGWYTGDKSEMVNVARLITEMGFHCAVFNYRLSHHAKYPAPVEDLNIGFDWLVKAQQAYAFTASSFIAFGVSAGGYLALKLGLERSLVDGADGVGIDRVISVVGPANISKIYQTSLPREYDLWDKFFVAEGGDTDALLKDASVTGQQLEKMPPCLIVHGEQDEMVPVEQAVELYNELCGHAPHQPVLKLLPEYGHSIPKEVFLPIAEAFMQRNCAKLT